MDQVEEASLVLQVYTIQELNVYGEIFLLDVHTFIIIYSILWKNKGT